MNYVKNNLLFILAVLLVFSCTKSNDLDVKPEEEQPNEQAQDIIPFQLVADVNSKNIFEMVNFKLSVDDNTIPSVFSLAGAYDSIVWKDLFTQETHKILQVQPNGASLTFGWGHNFFRPGYHTMCLIGYKDNMVVYSSDSITINAVNTKDFLGYNWGELDTSVRHSVGYSNKLYDNELATTLSLQDSIPGITFFIWNSPKDGDKILTDIVTRIYDAPVYDENHQTNLIEAYETLFYYKKEHAVPQKIWITDRTKMVLLKIDTDEDFQKHQVYAEPK